MSSIREHMRRIRMIVETSFLPKIRISQDREHEILINRLVFCAIFAVFLYFWKFDTQGSDAQVIGSLKAIHLYYSVAAVLLLAHLYVNQKISRLRRFVAIVADIQAITFGMAVGGEYTAIGYPLYLWVIFGNGFRFGNTYLMTAAALTLAGFTYVVANNSFWGSHLFLVAGLFGGLIMLPAYAARLIKKLSDARRKAEEANRAKGLFIASVSHELRTPLTSIIGLGELLQSTNLTSEQDNMVRTISSAGRSLLRMINSILNIAKAEEGHRGTLSEKIDLFQLLSDIRAMLSVQAQSKETRLVVEINPSTPQFIQGNFRHLEEILINLIGNAVKFTLRGSVRVLVNATPEADGKLRLRCDIYDTGIGIAPEKQGRIFQRFTQADESILSQFGGSGLGLAITKQLVELYNGLIGVNSALGQGSHFWFEIDVAAVEADQDVISRAPSTHVLYPDGLAQQPAPQAYKILVAEDNITNQKIISKILTLAGHDVIAVENGELALDALLGQHFDLALMDINMPIMNGLEATRLYHFSDVGHDHTPIIALTADTSEQTRRRCLDAGIRAFCTKPIETDRLLAIISQVANTYGTKKAEPELTEQTDVVAVMPPSSPSLDPDVLSNLSRLGGEDFCNDIISEFLNESSILASALKQAVLDNDLAAFHANAHSLQSCAGNIGAMRTVDILVKWQEIDSEELRKGGPAVLKSLQNELDLVRNVLFNRSGEPDQALAS